MIFNETEITSYVEYQVKTFFNTHIDIQKYQNETLKRVDYCFSQCTNKGFEENQTFSTFHSGQYCVYLYFLSNTMFKMDGNGDNAEKIYYLNKLLNNIEIFYEVEMPAIFNVEHPLGSIMGRAVYSDRFFFYQGCTIGGSNRHYPVLGENVMMFSNSKILGKSNIGNNVILAANSYVIDEDVPDNCIVFGQSPELTIKKKDETEIKKMISDCWRY